MLHAAQIVSSVGYYTSIGYLHARSWDQLMSWKRDFTRDYCFNSL